MRSSRRKDRASKALGPRIVALPWWVGKKAWGGYWVVLTKQVEAAVLTALGTYWVQGHLPQVEDMISKELDPAMRTAAEEPNSVYAWNSTVYMPGLVGVP